MKKIERRIKRKSKTYLFRIAESRSVPALGYRTDDIRFHRMVYGQLSAALRPNRINFLSFENTIGPREINIFENAKRLFLSGRSADYVHGTNAILSHL